MKNHKDQALALREGMRALNAEAIALLESAKAEINKGTRPDAIALQEKLSRLTSAVNTLDNMLYNLPSE